MKIPLRTILLFSMVTFCVIIPFIIWGGEIDRWTMHLIKEGDTHPVRTGLILAALLASDIIMPIPSSIASTACGLILGFAYGTLTSFVGMSISTAAGYLIGRFAAPLAVRILGEGENAALKSFHRRHGLWMLLAMRPVPVMAEASVIFAGLARMPPGGVMKATILGNLLVSTLYAAVGSFGRLQSSTFTAFALAVLLSAVMMLVSRAKAGT